MPQVPARGGLPALILKKEGGVQTFFLDTPSLTPQLRFLYTNSLSTTNC